MRGTKRFERRITSRYFKVGELRTVSGDGEVTFDANAGVPFEYLKIKGVTKQPLPNRTEEYFSQIKDAGSYVDAGIVGTYTLALPTEFVGKKLTYELKSSGSLGGVLLYLSDGDNPLFSNLTPLCNSNGQTFRVSGDGFTHLIFTNVYTSEREEDDGSVSISRDGLIDFWSVCDLIVEGEISPGYETPVICVGDTGVLLTIEFNSKIKRLNLPKEIQHQDSKVPLLMSEYDELEIRVLENRVIYREGSVRLSLTGDEPWQINTSVAPTGRGLMAYYYAPVSVLRGYCPYLTFTPWPILPSQKNIFTMMSAKGLAIKFERNETGMAYYKVALSEITNFLKEKHQNAATVQIIAKRAETIEHDITSTTLAGALLSHLKTKGDGKIVVRGAKLLPHVEARYYSSNEGAKVYLTVKYQNESGTEIATASCYELRMGSAYKINAPEIDGYTPKSSELWGAAKENKTVIIEYEEIK